MYEKIVADPKITVSLKSDENATMKLISDIHTQLREANALKLSYSALSVSLMRVDPLLEHYPVRIREVTIGVILSISFLLCISTISW